MSQWETMWEFETPTLLVVAEITPDDDADLSWADEETLEGLREGTLFVFGTRVRVFKCGVCLGEDSLWGSVYKRPSDFFKEHYGARSGGWGSYFPDMVRSAVKEARAKLEELRSA